MPVIYAFWAEFTRPIIEGEAKINCHETVGGEGGEMVAKITSSHWWVTKVGRYDALRCVLAFRATRDSRFLFDSEYFQHSTLGILQVIPNAQTTSNLNRIRQHIDLLTNKVHGRHPSLVIDVYITREFFRPNVQWNRPLLNKDCDKKEMWISLP